MPFMTGGKRDYKKEDAWDKTHKSKNGVARGKARAMRNKARAMVAAKKGVAVTSIKGDVGHKKAVSKGGQSVLANLFIQNASNNRSFSRNAKGAMISETSKKERKRK
jgi:hypothetical protein